MLRRFPQIRARDLGKENKFKTIILPPVFKMYKSLQCTHFNIRNYSFRKDFNTYRPSTLNNNSHCLPLWKMNWYYIKKLTETRLALCTSQTSYITCKEGQNCFTSQTVLYSHHHVLIPYKNKKINYMTSHHSSKNGIWIFYQVLVHCTF